MVGGNDRWRREALCTFGPSVCNGSENTSNRAGHGEVTGPMPPAAVAIAAVSTAAMAPRSGVGSFDPSHLLCPKVVTGTVTLAQGLKAFTDEAPDGSKTGAPLVLGSSVLSTGSSESLTFGSDMNLVSYQHLLSSISRFGCE